MAATAIRQAPGWSASIVRAECDNCGWRGPDRYLSERNAEIQVDIDKRDHMCGDLAEAAGFIARQTEPCLWTVGHYSRDGRWNPVSDHSDPAEAHRAAHELNAPED